MLPNTCSFLRSVDRSTRVGYLAAICTQRRATRATSLVNEASQKWLWENTRARRSRYSPYAAAQQLQTDSRSSMTVPLAPGEVHIWWLQADEVQSSALQEKYMQLLPPAEQDYVSEGASAKIRKERLLARTLVRVILARYCEGNVSPTLLCFESSPNGKPWLVSEEGCTLEEGALHFNLTHTDDLLGVAVARERCVGLDAESSNRLTKADPLKLARRRFSAKEFAVLEGFENTKERAKLFMRLWTLKEAYVKATGRGIGAHPGLRAFTFELLLQTSVKRRKQQLPTPPLPAEEPLKSSAADAAPAAEIVHRRPRNCPVSELRLPFWVDFSAAESDPSDWEAVLMEISGGHTAALVVEGKNDTRKSSRDGGSSRSGAFRLRMFKTVPLLSEEEAGDEYARLIGYGCSK